MLFVSHHFTRPELTLLYSHLCILPHIISHHINHLTSPSTSSVQFVSHHFAPPHPISSYHTSLHFVPPITSHRITCTLLHLPHLAAFRLTSLHRCIFKYFFLTSPHSISSRPLILYSANRLVPFVFNAVDKEDGVLGQALFPLPFAVRVDIDLAGVIELIVLICGLRRHQYTLHVTATWFKQSLFTLM